MWIKLHHRSHWRHPFYKAATLPIQQFIFVLGPISLHVAWGKSAKLIRKAD